MASRSASPETDHAGRRLGDFVLHERVAAAAFGALYRAERIGLASSAVVKLLCVPSETDEALQRRFLLEAQRASTLGGASAPTIVGYGVEDDGVWWVATETPRGAVLGDDRMHADPIDWRGLVPSFEALWAGLHEANGALPGADRIATSSEVTTARLTAPGGQGRERSEPRDGVDGAAMRPRIWAKGRIEIVRPIGAGGMGLVYEAVDRERNERVAVKALRQMDPASLFLFKREFRALQEIHHENLVRYGELFEEDGVWFFTMELLDGRDLLAHVRDVRASTTADGAPAPFDEARVRDAFDQLTRGLVEVHRARKVHRDVKPSNVLVTRRGRVVLLDFGVATDVKDASGLIAGTAAFMAPEQALGEPLGPAADFYALGATLYAALTGRAPFDGSPMDVMAAKLERLPPRPRDLAPFVPPDLDALCMELLAIAPQERPQADEILRRLGGDAAEPALRRAEPPSGDVFIGRSRELAELRAAFAQTTRGEAAVVLVEGESGVGKTALVRRFTADLAAEDPRVLVLAGRCFERESVPYKALDALLDALVVHLAERPADVPPLVPPDIALLVRVFPGLRAVGLFAEAATAPPAAAVGDAQELRARVFAAVRALLDALARRHPLVLHVDDLQWADADSFALLEELFRPPAAPPMLLLATVRTSAHDGAGALGALTRPWSVRVRRLDVRPLSRDESMELVARLARGGPPGATDAESIAAEAGGHPLFIAELVWQRPEPGAAAVHLDDVLWARVTALEPPARRLLHAIAMAGSPVGQELAAEVASIDAGELMTLTGVLRAAHLVRTHGPRLEDLVEPYHARVRETVVARSDAAERKGLHRRFGEALETRGAGDPETLAEHWVAAGEPARAHARFVEAAEHAAQAFAFNRAADLYGRAIELHPGVPDDALPLARRRAEALALAGRGAEAAAIFSELAARGPRADALEMNRRAALEYLKSGHVDAGMERVREVLAAVGMRLAPNVFFAVLSILLRRAYLRLRGTSFEPRADGDAPAALRLRLDVTWIVSTGLASIEPVHAADFQTRAMVLSLATGNRAWVARSFCTLTGPIALEGTRARPRAERMVARCHELTKDQSPYLRGLAWLSDGCGQYGVGNWSAAVEMLTRAHALFEEESAGSSYERQTASMFHLVALVNRGDLREVAARSQVLLDDARRRGDLFSEYYLTTLFRTVCLLAANRPLEARQGLAAMVARWSRRGFHVQHWWALIASILIDLYEGSAASAHARLVREWTPLVRSLMLRLEIVRIEAIDLRAHTALAAASTSSDDAEPRLREAARYARKLAREKAPHAVPRATAIRAALAAHRGDWARGLAELARAEQQFRDVEMNLLAALCRRRRGELVGGAEGSALVEDADAWLRGQDVERPERMAMLFAPAFPRRPAPRRQTG